MIPAVAELYEEFGQALAALRANAAILLRRAGGQPDVQAAARDVEAQGAAIDRRLRALLHELPDDDVAAGAPLAARLHAALENWHDRHDPSFSSRLHVTPPSLRAPGTQADALCQMSLQALDLAALSGGPTTLDIAVFRVAGAAPQLVWSATDGRGLALTAQLPLDPEVA